jgi:ribosomal protein S6
MRYYELNYLIPAELSNEELRVTQEEINSFIKENGGVLDKYQNSSFVKLGYQIKGKERALLSVSNFYFEPEKLDILEKKLKADNKILRYLILISCPPRAPLQKPLEKIRVSKTLPEKQKKVEIKEIDKKLKEILGE